LYHTTGLYRDEIVDVCDRIRAQVPVDEHTWPPILGLYMSVVVTLAYTRRNRVQDELAETYGVSQPTISRAISSVTPLLERVLRPFVPTADELDPDETYIVDGTLLPCWSWAGHRELYSGKHKTTGLGVQVACTARGRLAWISDPVDGCRHDTHGLRESGALTAETAPNWTGDKAYVGNRMDTPFRKPIYRDLLDWEKDYNTSVNKTRWVIEQVIAHLKTWRILHTDYRRPLATFTGTIAAVVALHFYLRS